MSIELPLYTQEKRNTCALACLRMVLGAFGRHMTESVLEAEACLEARGTSIEELERLARQFQIVAEVREATVEEFRALLWEDKLPIVYIDRAVFELRPRQRARRSLHDAIIHTVIPIQVTSRSVWYHDPRWARPTRRTRRLFGEAFDRLGGALCRLLQAA
jgi:Peptidase C39 family